MMERIGSTEQAKALVGLHEDMSEITHFTSKEMAKAAGYRPCKICKP
jgi:hypothetical protein